MTESAGIVLSVLPTTNALTSVLASFNTYRGRVQQSRLKGWKDCDDDIKSAERRVLIMKETLSSWSNRWAIDDEEKRRIGLLQCLWGTESFEAVALKLLEISNLSLELEKASSLHDESVTHSRTRSLFRLLTSGYNDQKWQALLVQVDDIKRLIDEMVLYTDMALRITKPTIPFWKLDDTAEASVATACTKSQLVSSLFDRCKSSRTSCQVGLRLSRSQGVSRVPAAEPYDNSSVNLCLVSVDIDACNAAWQEMRPRVVCHIPGLSDQRTAATGDLQIPDNTEVDVISSELLKFRHVNFEVFMNFRGIPSLENTAPVLSSILVDPTALQASQDRSIWQYTSLDYRLILATQVVEAAFGMIGTPWLSALRSSNIRRVHTGDGGVEWVLFPQILDPVITPNSLTHLSNLGVLLAEIGLGRQLLGRTVFEGSHWTKIVPTLVELGRAVGSQYRYATSFCFENEDYGFSQNLQEVEDVNDRGASNRRIEILTEHFYKRVVTK